MNLAHQTPHARKINDTELFRWNYTDTSQFVLVDPDSAGWSLMFVPESGAVPAHLLIKCPKSASDQSSPVFLLIKEDVGADHAVHSVHDIPSRGMVGAVDRYAGPDDFLATLHSATSTRIVNSEDAHAKTLVQVDRIASGVVTAKSTAHLGLVQVHVAGVTGAHLDESDCSSLRSGRAGFMLYAPADLGESVRLFDLYVERIR